MQAERLRILNLLAAGRLTVEQAERLLQALHRRADETSPPPAPTMPERPYRLERMRRFWLLPILLGGGLATVAGFGFPGSGVGALVCVRLPAFALGVLLGLFGLGLRASTWVHVRVHQPEGEWPRHITVLLPLPLSTLIALVRLFGWLLPLEAPAVEALLRVLGDLRKDGTPLRVEVQDADGDLVEVFVG